jgi:hypothetical protein
MRNKRGGKKEGGGEKVIPTWSDGYFNSFLYPQSKLLVLLDNPIHINSITLISSFLPYNTSRFSLP